MRSFGRSGAQRHKAKTFTSDVFFVHAFPWPRIARSLGKGVFCIINQRRRAKFTLCDAPVLTALVARADIAGFLPVGGNDVNDPKAAARSIGSACQVTNGPGFSLRSGRGYWLLF